jgi:hypothetical protein
VETEAGVLQHAALVDHAEAAFTPEDKGGPSEFRAAISALSLFKTVAQLDRIISKAMTTQDRLIMIIPVVPGRKHGLDCIL